MSNKEIWEELESFVQAGTGTFDIPLLEDTLIEDGLGCTGDDGIELITGYSKKFNVDISSFIFRDYFYPEPGPFGVPNYKIKPLTVGDLFRGIQAGKLNDSVIGKK
jgi:Protein of unknown function (DUF1493)